LQPATIRVTSELPVGAGLGSSASYCVALTAALLAFAGELDLPQQTEAREDDCGKSKTIWLDVNEKKLDLVNRWAFEGERIMHGRPSGIENTVSTYGKILGHYYDLHFSNASRGRRIDIKVIL
jgi:mevalonate kinase